MRSSPAGSVCPVAQSPHPTREPYEVFVTRRTHSQVGSTVLNLSSLTRHALKQWLSNAYGIAASGRSLVLRPPLPSLKNSAPPRAGRGVEGLPSLSESFRLGKGLLRDSLALGGRSWLFGFGWGPSFAYASRCAL